MKLVGASHTNRVCLYSWDTHPVRVCSSLYPVSASLFCYISVWGLVYMILNPYIFVHVLFILLLFVFFVVRFHMCWAFHTVTRLLTTMCTILSCFHILCNRMEVRRNMKVRHCRCMIRTQKLVKMEKKKKTFSMICLFY